MVHIYYFLGMLLLMSQMYYLSTVKSRVDGWRKSRDWINNNKGVKWQDMPKEVKHSIQVIMFQGIPLIFWTFIGLFSFQWIVFLTRIAITYLVLSPLAKVLSKTSYKYVTPFIASMVEVSFLTFAILNAYHLKMGSMELLSYINSLWS